MNLRLNEPHKLFITMFSRENRLAKDRDVNTVYRAGRTFFSPIFTLKFLRGSRVAHSRITIVVSLKVAKQAVKRNTIKRVLREVFKANFSKLRVGDYMVMVRPAAARLTRPELASAMALFLEKNHLVTRV